VVRRERQSTSILTTNLYNRILTNQAGLVIYTFYQLFRNKKEMDGFYARLLSGKQDNRELKRLVLHSLKIPTDYIGNEISLSHLFSLFLTLILRCAYDATSSISQSIVTSDIIKNNSIIHIYIYKYTRHLRSYIDHV
jgi:hypothetical protein